MAPLPTPPPEALEAPAARSARLLREYLADRDAPCPRCGYNLRALTGDACPECGDLLRLQVGLVEPRLGAYIALLVMLAVGVGASTLFGGVALARAPSRFWSEPSGILLLVQWGLTAVALPLALLYRRPFRRLSPRAQEILAIAAALLVGALSIAIVACFRN